MSAVVPLKLDSASKRPAQLQSGDNGLIFGNATLDASGLTAAHTLTLPNKAGTLACTSDIPSSISIAVARNIGTMRAY